MFLQNKSLSIKLIVIVALALLTGFGCKKDTGVLANKLEDVHLTYWQVWQNSFDIQPIIKKYNQLYPQVKISFRNLRYEEYEEEMLKALAEDRGPDVFSIPHDWIGLYKNIIAPQPESVSVKRPIIKQASGTQLEPTIEQIVTDQSTLITAREIKQEYYPFIKEDILSKEESANTAGAKKITERVMALPLNIDALVLYYNKDILEQSEIFEPPATWENFQTDVIALTKLGPNDEILQAGAALGAVNNLIRPTDILVALMMQTGVQMVDDGGTYTTFHQSIRAEDKYNAGLEALRFYSDFSDPAKKVYTWNEKMENAVQVFKQGKLAFLFGYSYSLPEIRASKINFGVAPIPTPVIKEGIARVTVANYWVETVSKKSKNQEYAWHFLNFLSHPENLLDLQAKTGRLSPRKIHASELTDLELAVFASQMQDARVWYHGKDAPTADKALMDMISSVASDTRSLEEALSFGAQLVTQTLR